MSLTRTTWLRSSLAAACAAALAFVPVLSRAQTNEAAGGRVHPSARKFRELLGVDRSQAERVKAEFERFRRDLRLEPGAKALPKDPAAREKFDADTGALLSDKAAFDAAARFTAELYRIGGPGAVQEAFARGWIDEAGSARLAAVRNEMLARSCDRVASRYGSIGVNNFSIAQSVKSDIDFTLFSRWHDPKYVVPRGPDGKQPSGMTLKAEFGQAFAEMWGIEPDKMEIAAHAQEANMADWRGQPETAKFAVELRKGTQLLIENPEAYFLEGAYRMQIERRSFKGRTPLFTIHNGNLAGEGVDRREYRLASDAIFRNVPPEFRNGYAFGATVGNMHFFRAHSGDPAHFAKYVLRSVEDGMRLLVSKEPQAAMEWKDWKDIGAAERAGILDAAYPAGSAVSRQAAAELLARALEIREAVAAGNYDPGRVFEADMRRLYNEKFPNAKGGIPADMREGLIKDAVAAYEAKCSALMMQNCITAAKARAADWTDAAALARKAAQMKKEKNLALPDVDEAALTKNLKLSTFYEFYVAFHHLDADTRQAIMAQADPGAKAMLNAVNASLSVKEKLFRFPPREKAANPDFYEKLAQRWDAEMDKLRAVGYDIAKDYNRGEYTPTKMGLRMQQWALEAIGFTFEKPLAKAEQGEKLKGKFESRKLVGNIVNAGNLDSLLSIIRTGEETDWDPYQVGQAVFFEAVGNVPYAGPLMAVKGALVDGEPLGLAILAGAYVWPGVGQIYLAYSIASSSVEIVDHESREGLVDMMLDGVSPDAAAGPVNTIRNMLGTAWDDAAGIAAPANTFYSVLKPVTGMSPEERRKGFFAYVDAVLDGKLKEAGCNPLEWDAKKERIIEAYFGTWLRDFENVTGPFAGDELLRRHWASSMSRKQAIWLKDEDFRGRLIARLSKMYITGLHKRALEEGQKLAKKMEEGALDCAGRIASFEDQAARTGEQFLWTMGELTGAIDYPEPEVPKLTEPEPAGQLVLEAGPEARIRLGKPLLLQARVEATSGRFRKPFHWKWSFVNAKGSTNVGEDVEICTTALGESLKDFKTARIRVEALDDDGRQIGSPQEAELPVVGEPEPGSLPAPLVRACTDPRIRSPWVELTVPSEVVGTYTDYFWANPERVEGGVYVGMGVMREPVMKDFGATQGHSYRYRYRMQGRNFLPCSEFSALSEEVRIPVLEKVYGLKTNSPTVNPSKVQLERSDSVGSSGWKWWTKATMEPNRTTFRTHTEEGGRGVLTDWLFDYQFNAPPAVIRWGEPFTLTVSGTAQTQTPEFVFEHYCGFSRRGFDVTAAGGGTNKVTDADLRLGRINLDINKYENVMSGSKSFTYTLKPDWNKSLNIDVSQGAGAVVRYDYEIQWLPVRGK